MKELYKLVLVLCLGVCGLNVNAQIDTCNLYKGFIPTYECTPPIGNQETPPSSGQQFLGGGGCNFVNNGEFSLSPQAIYTAVAPGDFCGNSLLNGWMPISLANNIYQWMPCDNFAVCPQSPSPDIFDNDFALIPLLASSYDENNCFSFNANSNFLNVI